MKAEDQVPVPSPHTLGRNPTKAVFDLGNEGVVLKPSLLARSICDRPAFCRCSRSQLPAFFFGFTASVSRLTSSPPGGPCDRASFYLAQVFCLQVSGSL